MLTDRTVGRAFEVFVKETEPRLREALSASLGSERGREATAEALAYAWEHWERIREMENPTGYLYVLGRDRGRKASRRQVVALLPVESSRIPWVEPGLIGALEGLPERQRVVVMLLYCFEWTMGETAWFQEAYIGFGSSRPFYVGGGGPTPRVWTSADLDSWVERIPRASSLPSDGFIQADTIGQSSFVGDLPVGTTTSDEQLAVSFQVFRNRPGLESVESIQQLGEWLDDAGLPPQSDPSLEELLDSVGVTFPMDPEEAEELASFLGVQERYGTLTLSTSNGTEWESVYAP